MKHLKVIQLLQKGYGEYKLQIAVLAFLGFLGGALEGIGINAIMPVFSRLTDNEGADDIISQALSIMFGQFGVGVGLKVLLLFIVFAFIAKAIIFVIATYVTAQIETNYARNIRSRLFRGTLEASWPFLISQKGGYLETALLIDVERSRLLLRYFGNGIIALTTLIVYVVIAFNISSIITLLSLGLGGVLFLVLKPIFFHVRSLSKRVAETNKELGHHVNENILGLKAVKSAWVQEHIFKKAYEHFTLLKNAQLKINLLNGILNVFLEPVSVVFIVVIFSFSYLAMDFQFTAFAVIMYLIHRIFTRVQSLQSVAYKINEALPYLEHIIDVREKISKHRERYRGEEPFNFEDRLEFRDVDFAYSGKRSVLSHLTFSVARGEMIGIVGKSGVGKTTIVDLLLRLLMPSGGEIYVDSMPIRDIEIQEWRRNIGYVSQDIFVINDTIENNIRFYDVSISDQQVINAAKMAYIYDFIKSQPKQFKSSVGERGIMLSGGEKQRLVLTRVLARNPSILILDEATSSLDNESELMIQKAIDGLHGKMTIIVIAHRLSTLSNCDNVFILEGGRIREKGSPALLLKDKDSRFYKTYNIRDSEV